MYIKKEDAIINIPAGWKQVFHTKFTLSVGQKEIVKMRNEGTITDRDLEVARLLFKFRFGTLEQISRYLGKNEGKEVALSTLRNRLDKLVGYKVLNKFMLTQNAGFDKIPSDAKEFYCLDLGGRYLLSHYTNEDTSDWHTAVNMKSSDNVAKNLTILNFYLSLYTTAYGEVEYFNVEPELRVGKKVVSPSFELSYKSDGMRHFFMGEVVKDFDFPVQFRDKAQKLSRLLNTDAWMKYCLEAKEHPVLFVISDTDELAAMVAKHIHEATELRRFRVTTDERIEKPVTEKGTFLRYDEERGALVAIAAKVFG